MNVKNTISFLVSLFSYSKNVSDVFDNIKMIGDEAFTFIASKIGLSTAALGKLGIAGLAIGATFALVKYEAEEYTRALNKCNEASQEFSNAKSELESLSSEYDNVQSKIEELQALVSNGTITMAQEVELENLQKQNDILETQLKIQEELVRLKGEASANAAKNASNTEKSYIEYMQEQHGNILGFLLGLGGYVIPKDANHTFASSWNEQNTTEQGLVETNLNNLKTKEFQLSEINKQLINDPTNKVLQERQKSLNDEILATRQNLADSTSLIQSWIAQSTDANGNVIDGAESAVDSWRETLNDINNYGKSQNEIDLNNLNTFFSSSNGKSIKRMLDNVAKSGGNAEDALEEFRKTGLSLEDIDVSSDGFKRYFQDIIDGLKETENKIAEFDGSLASVETAFNTANQDSKWASMTEYIASAKEMYDSGLVGTDDFKSVAQMISASPIDVDNEKYKYDADAYVDAWNNTYSQVKSWFNADDQEGSAYNFAESLKTAGLATYDSQDGYTWLFKSSAEAAKELGTSIEIVEAAMGNLEAQGAEFADVIFSGEALNSYNSALSQVEDIYDNLSDNSILKDRFNEVLAESELQDFANNLEDLTEDQIIQIEFEYDLATVEQEIQKAKDRILKTGGSNEDYASLTSLQKEERGLLETQVDSSMLSGGYEQASSTIDALGQKMVAQYSTLGEEGRRAIQQQQSALLSLQTSFLDMASRGEVVDWNSFLNTPQASSVIQGLADSMGVDFDTALKTLNDSLSESLDVDDVEFDIKANDKASEVVEKVDKLTMAEKVTEVIAHDEATHVVQLWEELSMNDKFANMSAEDQFTYVVELWESLTPEDKTAYMNGEITVSDFASPVIDNVTSEVASIPKETTTDIKANDKVTGTVQNITTTLNYLDGKTVHTYVVTHHQSKGDGELSGSTHLKGTAFDGGTISDTSWLKDNWRIPSDEYALTGERGMEMYVDPETNTWETLGEKGAEFRHIPKGAVVFNAEQTKKLLSRGYIFSRGKALLNGTAHLGEGNGWRPNPSSTYSGSSGTGSSNNSGNSNSNNNNNNNSDSESAEKLDWIAVLLSRIQRVITNIGKVASATFKSWTERSTALESQISSTRKEMEYQKQGAERYLQEAESLGLDPEYAKKVQDGTIDIESIEDEELRKKIDEYTQWYELFLSCSDAVQDLEQDLADLSRQKFDNIIQQYDDRLAEIEHSVNIIDSLIEQTEEKGYIIGASFYKVQQEQEQKNLETLMAERSALQKQLADSGFKEGTEEWNAMNQEIMDVEESIQDTTLSLIELDNQLKQLKFDSFERMHELISKITTESEFLVDMMSEANKFDSETGSITDQGMATLGLHAVDYNVAKAQAESYAKMVEELDKQLELDPFNEDLRKQRDEFWEATLDYQSQSKDSWDLMIDIISDGFDVFLEKAQELADKSKDRLQTVKDLYDFEKSVRETTEEIATLEKRLQAYSGDTSEESRAKIQETEKALADARENLEETQYDQYIKDQEQMLDQYIADIEEWISLRLEHPEELIKGVTDAINENSGQIFETLKEEADKMGYNLSEEMENIWNPSTGEFGQVVSEYNGKFETELTTVNSTLSKIEEHVANLLKDADKRADDAMKNQQESGKVQENAVVNSGNSNQSSTSQEIPKEEVSAKSDSGNFTIGGTINAGNAKIYASPNGGTGQSQYFANDPVYTVIGEQGDYVRVRWHKASSGSTGWFKKSDIKGYSNGGWIDETGLFMGHGSKSKPEAVLDAQDSQNLVDLTDMLKRLGSGNLSYGTSVNNPLMSSMYQMQKGVHGLGMNSVVQIDAIQMYGVNDPQEFARQLKHAIVYDPTVNKMIKETSVGELFGGNNYAVRKWM